MPAISVITPVYNRPQLLQAAVQSALDQSFTDREIIVVDDGSSDDLLATVPALSRHGVRYFRQPNQGAAAARNLGVAASQGDCLLFLDSDDTLMPDALGRLHAQLQRRPEAGIVHGWAVTNRPGRNDLQLTRPRLEGYAYRAFLYSNPLPNCTLLVRRQCLGSGEPFDRSLLLLEDWDLWQRLSFHNRFCCVPVVVARILFHTAQRTTSRAAGATGESLRAIYWKLRNDPAASEYVRRRWRHLMANTHVLTGHQYRLFTTERAAARREFVAAWRLAPDFLPAYRGLLETFLGERAVHWLRVIRSMAFSLRR